MPAAAAIATPLDIPALTGQIRSHVEESQAPPCLLHPAAMRAMQAMREAAAAAGIDLVPVSAFRSFEQQLTIWNEKFTGQRALLDRSGAPLDVAGMSEGDIVDAILQWSALPGASRHHWGSDFDVIDRAALAPGQQARLLPEEYAGDGVFARLAAWLTDAAADFGFFWPYDRDRGGVQPEPWHLSFAPLALPALHQLTVDVLANALADSVLQGRTTVFTRLPELHQRYVLAVAPPPLRALAAPAFNPASRPS